jgi:hypothetical protein
MEVLESEFKVDRVRIITLQPHVGKDTSDKMPTVFKFRQPDVVDQTAKLGKLLPQSNKRLVVTKSRLPKFIFPFDLNEPEKDIIGTIASLETIIVEPQEQNDDSPVLITKCWKRKPDLETLIEMSFKTEHEPKKYLTRERLKASLREKGTPHNQ